MKIKDFEKLVEYRKKAHEILGSKKNFAAALLLESFLMDDPEFIAPASLFQKRIGIRRDHIYKHFQTLENLGILKKTGFKDIGNDKKGVNIYEVNLDFINPKKELPPEIKSEKVKNLEPIPSFTKKKKPAEDSAFFLREVPKEEIDENLFNIFIEGNGIYPEEFEKMPLEEQENILYDFKLYVQK